MRVTIVDGGEFWKWANLYVGEIEHGRIVDVREFWTLASFGSGRIWT